MQTTTMEELAERLYTAKAQMSEWISAETLGPIPAWSDTQRTVKNAWYLVAQTAIDEASAIAAALPPPIVFEASAGESEDPKAIEVLGPHPQWAAISGDTAADWAAVSEVSVDVMEDLRRDVKPLPLKKKMHAEPVEPVPPLPDVAEVTIDPMEQNFPASGGGPGGSMTASVIVTMTGPGVDNTWQVDKQSEATWLSIDSPPEDTPQSASGLVSYTVQANTGATELRGSLYINGKTHTAIVAPAAVTATAAQASAHAAVTPPVKKANHK
jgi:hypothetical protein